MFRRGRVSTDKVRAEDPRYAGPAYRAFRPTGPGIADLTAPRGVTLERLGDRRHLRAAFDGLRRAAGGGEFAATDAFARQALDLATSTAVRDALDLSKEPRPLVDRYGDRAARFRYLGVEYGFDFESFLRARRLPTALTRAVWENFVQVPEGVAAQDEQGRLWDVLWMLRLAIQQSAGGSLLLYQILVRNDNYLPQAVTLKAVCGPDDQGEPCITVIMPGED